MMNKTMILNWEGSRRGRDSSWIRISLGTGRFRASLCRRQHSVYRAVSGGGQADGRQGCRAENRDRCRYDWKVDYWPKRVLPHCFSTFQRYTLFIKKDKL